MNTPAIPTVFKVALPLSPAARSLLTKRRDALLSARAALAHASGAVIDALDPQHDDADPEVQRARIAIVEASLIGPRRAFECAFERASDALSAAVRPAVRSWALATLEAALVPFIPLRLVRRTVVLRSVPFRQMTSGLERFDQVKDLAGLPLRELLAHSVTFLGICENVLAGRTLIVDAATRTTSFEQP